MMRRNDGISQKDIKWEMKAHVKKDNFEGYAKEDKQNGLDDDNP